MEIGLTLGETRSYFADERSKGCHWTKVSVRSDGSLDSRCTIYVTSVNSGGEDSAITWMDAGKLGRYTTADFLA